MPNATMQIETESGYQQNAYLCVPRVLQQTSGYRDQVEGGADVALVFLLQAE
jgi:hypothetical protein